MQTLPRIDGRWSTPTTPGSRSCESLGAIRDVAQVHPVLFGQGSAHRAEGNASNVTICLEAIGVLEAYGSPRGRGPELAIDGQKLADRERVQVGLPLPDRESDADAVGRHDRELVLAGAWVPGDRAGIVIGAGVVGRAGAQRGRVAQREHGEKLGPRGLHGLSPEMDSDG